MKADDINKELDLDNLIDLDKTIWKVLRSKPAKNNILRHYELDPYMNSHALEVGDVIKFGRVNFKVCAIKSSKIPEEIQGGYFMLERRDKKILQ